MNTNKNLNGIAQAMKELLTNAVSSSRAFLRISVNIPKPIP